MHCRVMGHNYTQATSHNAKWFDHTWLQKFVNELAPAYSANFLAPAYDTLKERWLLL